MRLPKDLLTNTYKKPNLFLCETDKTRICQLETSDMRASLKFNAYSELTFTVGRTYMNMVTGETQINPFYNKIEALRLVYLEGFGYFEIQDPEIYSDGIKEVKNVTAYSLEYTLSQKYLENLKVNTGEVDSIEVIVANGGAITPVTLYNQFNSELSLLDIVLEKIYGWSLGHIDESLETMSRQFDVSRASVYDFIVQDICEKFNCYAVFDTIENKINLYAESLISKFIGDGKTNSFKLLTPYDSIDTVTIDGYKTTAYEYQLTIDTKNRKTGTLILYDAPTDGAKIEVTDGSQQKWQTDVYVSFDNLAQEVNISYSAEDIKTVLTVRGQDDLDIRDVNMGIPYLIDLSYYYTVDWMGEDLYKAYTLYLQNSSKEQSEYLSNAKQMVEISGYIAFTKNRLSLQYSIADNVTSTTVGTYYVRGGTDPDYYYTEVQLPGEYSASVEHYYKLSGVDLDTDKFSKLYSALQTYFVSGESKDVSKIEEIKEYFKFVKDNAINTLITNLSNATTNKQKDDAILIFLDELWDQLGSVPLYELYAKPYKQKEQQSIDAGMNVTSHKDYWLYYPVRLVLDSLDKASQARTELIVTYQNEYDKLQSRNNDITSNASIYEHFTDAQLMRLSPFLREDEYTDDNFVKTDSDTIDTLMQTQQELLECGRIELSKLCEPKLSFSMDMANIFALTEFEPIIDQFQLGNLINVSIRSDYIKRARLLAVDINFDDFSDFSCEFGELTSLRTQSSIHADLLAGALTAGKSIASGQSYWEKGADLATSTDLKIQTGLLNAIDGLYSADKSVLIDNNGILLRRVLDNGEFSPYQIWLTNNNILVSTDGFDTAKTGIGTFDVDGHELYGVLAQAVLSGYIESSTIVGGTINIGDGAFVVHQDGTVTMNAKGNIIDGYAKTQSVEIVEAQINNIIDAQINNNSNTIVSSSEPENPSYNQLWLDTSVTPSRLKIFGKVDGQEYGEWIDCTEHLGQHVYTAKPLSYSVGDLWILSVGETCGSFGAGSMLKAIVSSSTFNASHWIDADEEYTELKNNIQQYFGFDPNTGLRIGQTDNKFYVNISSSEMGFYDNSEGQNQKVVSIGNNAATIKDLTVEDDAEFNCNATFNKQVQFGNFVWQIESNGSLSLAVVN